VRNLESTAAENHTKEASEYSGPSMDALVRSLTNGDIKEIGAAAEMLFLSWKRIASCHACKGDEGNRSPDGPFQSALLFPG
jgi:hypothetical protein